MSAHQALRAGTRHAHEQLDALFGRFDLSDRDDYGRFLVAHAPAVHAVEAALDAAGMAGLLTDWPARRRGHLIDADRAALGLDAPAPLPFATPATPVDAWGAAYVIEGSRLGGAMLARGVPAGLPTSYLAAPQPKGAWRAFLASLDAALAAPSTHAPAIRAAQGAFALFEAGGQRVLAR